MKHVTSPAWAGSMMMPGLPDGVDEASRIAGACWIVISNVDVDVGVADVFRVVLVGAGDKAAVPMPALGRQI